MQKESRPWGSSLFALEIFSQVVVALKLRGVRNGGHRCALLALGSDEVLEQRFGEYAAARKVVVIRFKRVERRVERSRQVVKLGLLLVGEGIEVHIIGSPAVCMRVDLVFDAVKSCHQQRRIAEIRVAGGVRIAQLKAAHIRRLGVGGDADDRAAIARGVSDGDGRLKARHQTLEGVGRRVRDGTERGNMLQKATDEPVRLLAEVRVTVVIGEHRLAVL